MPTSVCRLFKLHENTRVLMKIDKNKFVLYERIEKYATIMRTGMSAFLFSTSLIQQNSGSFIRDALIDI